MHLDKNTIIKLAVSALILIVGIVLACGIGRGGVVNYQKPAPLTAERSNEFSNVKVSMNIRDGQIFDASITSSGASDLLTDELRAEWAQSIVDNQSYENDVISSATLKYSADSVKEAAADIFAQAGLPTPEPAATAEPEPEPEPEAPANEGGSLTDGVYAVEKTTDFSTINVELTVEGGKVTAANITSEGANDLLTDEHRDTWEAQIVEKQAIDAVSGVTVSSNAVQEAVEQLLAGQDGGEAGALQDGTYTIQKTTDFSTIDVALTVEGGKVTAADIASEGANDLLTDEHRDGWEAQIVEKQAVDAVSGVTVSSNAVQEAVDELLAQAAGGAQSAADDAAIAELKAALADAEARAEAAEAKASEAEAKASEAEAKVAELEAAATVAAASATTEDKTEPESAASAEAEASGLADGTYAVRKTTDFSDIDVAITVLDGKLTQAVVYSEGANDLLTDEQRSAWAEQIVNEQAVDAVSGVTVSSSAVQEAVAELLAEARGEAQAPEAEEAPAEDKAETQSADASRFMRPRPVAANEAAEAHEAEAGEAPEAEADEAPETEADEAPAEDKAEAESADASRFMRPRPVAASEVAEALAGELSGEARLSAILPHIVTTMGDNRENSYVVDYLEQDPYLVNIYEGYGFAKDYGSARGHEYTLEDVAKTQRPHPKANCITCKTPDLHKMIEEQGVAVYSMPFDEVFPQMKNNVSCYTCHGDDMGNGGALKVTHQYVNEALGENVAAIQPATLSCGQCHIEYYFTPADSETMMPYHSVDEMTPEAILAYYDGMDFADWTQESTGTRMLKAQHPEMETFLQGKHAAFLTCADCHMPTETTDEGVAYRSHKLVSPLESEALLASCAQCHGDTDMTAYVKEIQDKVTARETEVGNKLSAMKDALADAVASGEWREDDLNALRKLHREAQWFFDYCYVENSEGAHNSELSMNCLNTSEAKIDEAMNLLNKKTT